MRTISANHIDELLYANATNYDIRKTMEENFASGVENIEPIAESFRGNNLDDTGYNVWCFLKNRKYKADGEHQKIKSPARFLEDNYKGIPADCKSYAMFGSALMAHYVGSGNVGFRYVAYKDLLANPSNDTTPTHVYTIFRKPSGEVVTIDAVDGSDEYNEEQKNILKKKISG